MELPFSTKQIAEVHSSLEEYFGFSLEDLNEEFAISSMQNLSDEEKEIREECREEGTGITARLRPINLCKFILSINKQIIIRTTEDFRVKIENLCKQYSIENETFIFSLSLMAAIINREETDCETEYLKSHLYEYNYRVRPDMLKLYIAITKPTDKHSDDSFTIKKGDNKSLKIEDASGWFSNALHQYLKKYLGVESVKEAERELYKVYGGKVGPQIKPAFNAYMWGTYHLLQETRLRSETEKSVTNDQCRFIEEYLRAIGLINPKEIKVDYRNIRGRINSYLKKDYLVTLKDIIDERDYNFSPNNKDGLNAYDLW